MVVILLYFNKDTFSITYILNNCAEARVGVNYYDSTAKLQEYNNVVTAQKVRITGTQPVVELVE